MSESGARSPDAAPHPEARIVADGHVHIYELFALREFFDRAWQNLSLQGGGEPFHAALLLTETSRDDGFGRLRSGADAEALAPWRARPTGEPDSVVVERDDGARLNVIAGSQIVTSEDLEVLALASAQRFPDGASLGDTLDRVRNAGAVAAIPWGFGKWFGRRGELLARQIEAATPRAFWLGDNRGRPRLWPEPAHFRQGRSRGFGVLPGSDPLPMAAGAGQAGSFGFVLQAAFDPERPAESLRLALSSGDADPEPFGRREGALRFVRDQVWMQVLKRRRTQ